MIYSVHLPQETKDRLSEVVRLQMALLTFAARQTSLDPDEVAGFLNKQQLWHGRGEKIVNALQRGKSKGENSRRWQLLKEFTLNHDDVHNGVPTPSTPDYANEKQIAVRLMKRDISCLWQGIETTTFTFYMNVRLGTVYLPDGIPLTRQYAESQVAAKTKNKCKFPRWLCAAQEFLISFYDWLGNDIPMDLFSGNTAYGRQDTLAAFGACNPKHHVCAICDEHSFRTVYDGHYLSELEHYFPKTIYPHLACHPYNLIPICSACNQIHLDSDPLLDASMNRRKSLGEVFLPYRNTALRDEVIVLIESEPNDCQRYSFQVIDVAKSELFLKKLKAFGEIYRIPNRWQEKQEELGDHLWRRMRQFLADDVAAADVVESPQFIQQKMHRLLAYFEDDLGRDPLAFPSLWLLANLIVEEVDVDTPAGGYPTQELSPFLAEVMAWAQGDPKRVQLLQQRSGSLRDAVNQVKSRLRVTPEVIG